MTALSGALSRGGGCSEGEGACTRELVMNHDDTVGLSAHVAHGSVIIEEEKKYDTTAVTYDGRTLLENEYLGCV
jgi:hypothetical protein